MSPDPERRRRTQRAELTGTQRAGARVPTTEAITRLHHIGVASTNARQDAEHWNQLLGYRTLGVLTHDPIQRVNVLFLARDGDDTLIELVEPAADDAPVRKFLSGGSKVYHVCYEVADLDETLNHARQQGALVVQNPVPAAAFDGRLIAWCFTKTGQLVEYLEQASSDKP